MKYENTAKRIREAMQDADITQQELADLSNIGKSSKDHVSTDVRVQVSYSA